jgi:hypothetical protein
MRTTKSPLHIAIYVVLGICILIGLMFIFPHYPGIPLSITSCTLGVFILYMAFLGIRRGWIRIYVGNRLTVFKRIHDPFMYWSNLFFFGLIGSSVFGVGVYFLLHPHEL